MTFRNQVEHEHSSSPTDRWSHETSKPRNRSLLIDILLQQPWDMALPTPDTGICIQFQATRYTEGIPILPPNWIQSEGYTHHIPKKKNLPETQGRLLILQEARKEAKAAHELARQKMMERITQGSKLFKLHNKVWLEPKHLKLCYTSKKLAPKRERPFKIIEVLSPLNYHLELLKSWKIHPIIHATLLSPYHENDIYRTNYLSPPPDLIEGEHEYRVGAIITHKRQGRGHVYLIKWKGYPTGDNSWEPKQNLTHATTILTKYKRRHHIA